MVDEEIRNVAPEPAGPAPVNRDKRPDPDVIEGEVAPPGDDEAAREPPAAEAAGEALPPHSAQPVATASGGLRAFASGALGGVIVAALAAGGGYYLSAPKTDLAQADAGRLSALEVQAQTQSAALAGLEKRLGAVEAANAENAPAVTAATEAVRGLTADVKGLHADLAAVRDEIPGLSTRIDKLESGAQQSGGSSAELSALAARIDKLESGAQQSSGSSAELSALAGRIDKIEAALAAPKSETRVAPEKPSAGDNAAAIAVVSGVLEEKLAAGAPIGPELAALERLGVDPAGLIALKAVVNGAPSGAALAASFNALAPKILAATSHSEQGSVADRFLAHIRGLVQVHDLTETAGDDPSALVSQIEAACRRGDAGAALSAFGKLPKAAREAAGDWAAQANARRAADEALQSIREAAIGRLTGGAKP
jgi:hypothetical protein